MNYDRIKGILTQELNLFFYLSRHYYLLIPIKEIHRVNTTSFDEKRIVAQLESLTLTSRLENFSAALTRSSTYCSFHWGVWRYTQCLREWALWQASTKLRFIRPRSLNFRRVLVPTRISHLSRSPPFLSSRSCLSFETLFTNDESFFFLHIN